MNTPSWLSEWLADAKTWEVRFEVTRSGYRDLFCETDEVEQVCIKDGERRVLWEGVEIRNYDHMRNMVSLSRNGKLHNKPELTDAPAKTQTSTETQNG